MVIVDVRSENYFSWAEQTILLSVLRPKTEISETCYQFSSASQHGICSICSHQIVMVCQCFFGYWLSEITSISRCPVDTARFCGWESLPFFISGDWSEWQFNHFCKVVSPLEIHVVSSARQKPCFGWKLKSFSLPTTSHSRSTFSIQCTKIL